MTAPQIVLTLLLLLVVWLFYLHQSTRIKLKSTIQRFDESEISNAVLLNQLETANAELSEIKSIAEERVKIINDYSEKYKPVIDLDAAIKNRIKSKEITQVQLDELNEKYKNNYATYLSLKNEIAIYSSNLETIEFGLYQPQFDFVTSEEYKQNLERNYIKQQDCIRSENAIVCQTEWTVEGSKTKGKQMTKKYSRLMLYAFNGECDALIAKLKWNTATRTKERIWKAFENINKLGESHNIQITNAFLNLKLEEMALSHEYQNKSYEEKEEQRRIREMMREEEKVQKEIEKAQREAIEEERRYQKALQRVREDLKYASPAEVEALTSQVQQLEIMLTEAHQKKERALSMAQQTKVGHIYVISNIGSFGEDIYKIGMTRRLEPMDRIRELGDASVPFYFDVHAIIYSENAPQLEYDLHKEFATRRLNRINGRKEFFRVTLDEIEEFVIRHAGAEIEFTRSAEAKEYRETLALIESLKRSEEEIEVTDIFPSSLP